jgi:23S rRNA pseudouridine1911/1915/1917 synthase
VNTKAKQRAWSRGPEPDKAELQDIPVDATPLAPLTAPEGQQVFDVGVENAGERLDRFLGQGAAARRIALSRTRLKALIEAGEVTIDENIARDPSTRLPAGARIVFEAPPPEESTIAGEDIQLAVVYEDEHLIVIDKPAGLVVHPAPGHAAGTLVNALIRHCGASLSGIGGVKRPGIVHRLDKDTSGLLVVAKTDAAHQGLAELFADHGRTGSLNREYLALCWGGFDGGAGKVVASLGRDPRHREKMAVMSGERGRHATTHWRLEENLGPASLIACQLETGRTHQIRVHMASIGHPLLGDSVYGSGFKTKVALLGEGAKETLAALDRQALHAAALGFQHPITGQELHFRSAPPEDFAALLRVLRDAAKEPGAQMKSAAGKGSAALD